MSRKATEFQKKEMSKMYRGKEIFKPLQTGWIDEHVACVREWVANIFFYRKGDTTLMFDAGYNYDRLEEKIGWLGIDPKSIRQIFITHQDTDHVGAVEADSPGLFRDAVLYVGETENRYLTGEMRRKVIYHLYKLPQVTIRNEKVLLKDGDVLDIDGIRVECFLVPGHTWGHMVYLVDDKYLFTGDTIWFGADGGGLAHLLQLLGEVRQLVGVGRVVADHILHQRHQLFLRAVLAAAAGVAVGMAAVVVGVGVLVLVVMRMGMRVRMGHTVGMGMRVGVDSFVVIVVKMHGSASLMIFVVLYRFLLIL